MRGRIIWLPHQEQELKSSVIAEHEFYFFSYQTGSLKSAGLFLKGGGEGSIRVAFAGALFKGTGFLLQSFDQSGGAEGDIEKFF